MSVSTEAPPQLQKNPVPDSLKHYGVQTVDEVLKQLKDRAAHRHTIDVQRVADLGLHWEDQGPSHTKAGYFAKVNGKEMRLNDGAVRTLNKLIKGPSDLRHWNQYGDRDAFVKAAVNILDNPGRRSHGMTMRTDGLEVNCFLPADYQIRDAHVMLTDFVEMLNDNIGDIKGVDVAESGYGDHSSFHVIMGDNLIPSVKAELGQFMMFQLSMSETGLADSRTMLGLYRTICTNSATREQTLAQWNHRPGSESRFYDATGETIRMAGYLKTQFTAVFGELFKMKLEHDPIELLNTMKSAKIISRDHWSSAKTFADLPTEDGRKCETHYDLFNALTRGARELPTLAARGLGEQAALNLFTAPGGLYNELKSAASRHRVRNDGENVVALN